MIEDTDDAQTTAMLRDWQDQDRRRAELLEQLLHSVLEVARTWQPHYASEMDRKTLDLAAAEVGHVAHQATAHEPTDAQATPIPCALHVAGTIFPAGTPFCDVIEKVMTALEAARRALAAQPAPVSADAAVEFRLIWTECHKVKGTTDGRKNAEAHALADWIMARCSKQMAAQPAAQPPMRNLKFWQGQSTAWLNVVTTLQEHWSSRVLDRGIDGVVDVIKMLAAEANAYRAAGRPQPAAQQRVPVYNPQPDGGYPGCDVCTCPPGVCAQNLTTQEERRLATARTKPALQVKPMFWVRLRSDGGYEGPIHNDVIEKVRKLSGAWSPLFIGAQQVDGKDGALSDTARIDLLEANPDWSLECEPEEEPDSGTCWQIVSGHANTYKIHGYGATVRETIDAASPQAKEGGAA